MLWRKESNYEYLTKGKVSKVILTMSVPTIISMLVTSIYNMADTYFVGQINTQATAAVGVSFAVMSVIQAIGFFFGQGSGTYISRCLGAKEHDKASVMASTAFFMAVAFGIVLSILGLAFLTPLSIALGSTPTILPYTRTFLGMVLIAAPFMIGSMALNNQMRFQGNALTSMIAMLSGAVANVALVPLFIFVFHMGIMGAGLGTLIGQAIGFVVVLAMSRRGENIRLSVKRVKIDSLFLKEVCRGGTPSLTRQGLMAISTSMLNVAAGAYGDAAIAGMSIVTRLCFVVISVVIGIGQGFQPLCGFCYGARLYGRVKQGYFFAIKLGAAFLMLCMLVGYPYAEQLVRIFRDDPAVIAVGATALRWQLISFPILPVIQMSNMMMQTTGNALPANILAAGRNGIFFIPLIYILPRVFGLTGVEACQAMADVCTFLLSLPLAYRVLSRMSKDASQIRREDGL